MKKNKSILSLLKIISIVVVFVVFCFVGRQSVFAFNINSPTGGDGYIPIIYTMANNELRIFTVYHRVVPSSTSTPNYNINCVVAYTDQICAGYPKYFSSLSGSSNTGPDDISTSTHPRNFVSQSKLYYVAQGSSDNGIGCFNLETGTNCGYFPLGNQPRVSIPYPGTVDGLEQIGTRLYSFGRDLQAYCFDISTLTACAGQPYLVADSTVGMPAYNGPTFWGLREIINNRIYLLVNYDGQFPAVSSTARVTCFDTSTNARCAGWTSLSANDPSLRFRSLFVDYDISNNPVGICTVANVWATTKCWNLSGVAIGAPPGLFTGASWARTVREETRVNNKTYFATQDAGFCYDFASQSQCVGFTGEKMWKSVNGGTTLDYGYTIFGNNCFLGLGDAGFLWSFNRINGIAGDVSCPEPTPVAPILHVITNVINDEGGTAVSYDFTVHVKFSGTDINGSPMPGVITPGTTYKLAPNTYNVSENPLAGYTSVIGGDCSLDGVVIMISGRDKTCIITNNDIARVADPLDPIVPVIGVSKTPSPLSLPLGPGSVTYNYVVWNVGGQQPLTDVTLSDNKCSPVTFLSGDSNINSKLDTGENWKYNCTTILSQTTTNTARATGKTNGLIATDTVDATVIVRVPLLPDTGVVIPLIHITKIPSKTNLTEGGGMITYTETVTNHGEVALSNVNVIDDKCSPVNYISGDTNGDMKLDITERWTYTCQTNLIRTTTNIATASGSANGLVARDNANATVVVAGSVPTLPKTGLSPTGGRSVLGDIGILSGILTLILVSLLVIIEKRRT